jgi:putative phosphoribosyl transferase
MFKASKAKILAIGTVAGVSALIIGLVLNLSKLQLRFKDRSAAGTLLADILESRIRRLASKEEIIVLGIPRGGVITAHAVAKKLSADFGIVIVTKLGEPNSREKAIGAIMGDGSLYLNEKRIDELEISAHYIEEEQLEQEKEIKYRRNLYLTPSKRAVFDSEISGRTVILVDDGALTGATIIAASRSIRKRAPKRLIIAIPVAPRHTVNLLKSEADRVEVISSPSSDFVTVGQFYESFLPVTHKQVCDILQNAKLIL